MNRPALLFGLLSLAALACSSAGPSSDTNSALGDGATPPSGGTSSGSSGGSSGGGSSSGASSSGSSGGSDAGSSGTDASADGGGSGGMTALQRKKAEMLTSIWENSTTVLQYPYSQNINDGRGYTSGRAGFCTGTGDAIQVVQCFDQRFGTGAANVMHKYMPALTTINQAFNSTGNDQADTSLLDAVGNYNADWGKSATDATTSADFDACQDQIVDLLYFSPGIAIAAKWGLQTALTKAALYDAEINHGDDGVAAFAKQANIDTGNTAQTPATAPLSITAESAWLHAFLVRRLAALKADPTWAQAVDRAAEYEKLRLAADWDLGAPIVTDAKAVTMFPGQGFKDSGYPKCTIAADGTVSGDAACTSPTGG
jgi:chitosanase